MRIGRMIMAVLAGSATLTAYQATAAHAAVATVLPIANEQQIVADTAHGHLFISQGTFTMGQGSYSDNSILVTNLDGTPVATIGGQDGVEGMTLSPDGSTVYAALSTGHAVTAISTTTLKQTASYSLSSSLGSDAAYAVAAQSGRIWVSYRDAGGTSAIGEINPAIASSFTPDAVPDSWVPFPPMISTDPSNTGVLVAASVGVSPPSVTSFNVSNPATVTTIGSTQSIQGCATWHGLAVLPGGAAFLCDGTSYSTKDFSLLNFYENSVGITAVAPDGAVALGSGATAQVPDFYPDLWIYPPSGTAPRVFYSLGGPDFYLVDAAWSADGTQLFAVVATTNSSGTPVAYTLTVLDPFRLATRLMLGCSANSAGYDAKIRLAHSAMTHANRTLWTYATR